MSLLDALFDKEKAVIDSLKGAGQKFATEMGCPLQEVQIRIEYAKDGNPYGLLYYIKQDEKGKLWEKRRAVKLEEII